MHNEAIKPKIISQIFEIFSLFCSNNHIPKPRIKKPIWYLDKNAKPNNIPIKKYFFVFLGARKKYIE